MATALSPLNTSHSTDGDVAAPITNSSATPLQSSPNKAAAALANANISSPHELTDWVDSVLDQLESRFDNMSNQVETRMKEMSNRIDALESSIEELITGVSAPLPQVKPNSEA